MVVASYTFSIRQFLSGYVSVYDRVFGTDFPNFCLYAKKAKDD